MDEERYAGKTGREWFQNGGQPDVCDRCDGCGEIASSDKGEAWWAWMTLPKPSRLAVTMGIVKPVACPQCKGTGKA